MWMPMKLIPVLLALVVSACTGVTVPVVGQFSSTKDDFMGSATATLSDGTMKVQSESGLMCDGTLTRPSVASGTGTLRCSDGRTGTLVFTKSGNEGGIGFGTLSDGEKFRFAFGSEVRQVTERCEQGSSMSTCTRTRY